MLTMSADENASIWLQKNEKSDKENLQKNSSCANSAHFFSLFYVYF